MITPPSYAELLHLGKQRVLVEQRLLPAPMLNAHAQPLARRNRRQLQLVEQPGLPMPQGRTHVATCANDDEAKVRTRGCGGAERSGAR